MRLAIVADVVDTMRQWAADAVEYLGSDGLLWLAVGIGVLAGLIILWLAWRSGRIKKMTPKARRKSSSGSLRGLRARGRELRSLFSSKERYEVPMCLILGGDKRLAEAYSATLTRHGSSHRSGREPKVVDQGVFGWGDRGELYSIPTQLPLDEGEFSEGLRKLADYRPERPADGVVLNFPISVLRDTDEELDSYAESLCAQLQVLQREWSFSLPIYVVVTGLEQVKGFAGFLDSSSDTPHEMFGWSGVLLPSDKSEAQWCAAAIDMLQQRLLELQLMQPLSPSEGTKRDNFMFPLEIDALTHRIRKAMMLTFTDSVHYARDEVRGLYFAASTLWTVPDAGVTQPAGTVQQAPALSESEVVVAPLAFVKDLLEKKVFAEHRLGKPLARGVLSKNRTLRNIQIGIIAAAVIAFSFLGIQSYSLHQQVSELDPALERMAKLADEGAKELKDKPEDQRELVGLARQYVKELPNLQASSLEKISMPTSYIYSLDERLADRMSSRALPGFIFPVMACQMQNRGTEIVGIDHSGTARAKVPRLLSLKDAVTFLEQLEKIQRLSLPGSDETQAQTNDETSESPPPAAEGAEAEEPDGESTVDGSSSSTDAGTSATSGRVSPSLEMFDQLVEYTLDFKMGDDFYEASDLYERALNDTYYEVESGGPGGYCKLDQPWARGLASDVDKHMARLRSFENELLGWESRDPHAQALAQLEQWSKGDFAASGSSVSMLVEQVEGFAKLAKMKQDRFFPTSSDGVGGDEAIPCRELRERLEKIAPTIAGSASNVLLKTVTEQASQMQCDVPLRSHMRGLQYPWIGPLFVSDVAPGPKDDSETAEIIVNPKLDELVAALKALDGTKLGGVNLDDLPPRTSASPAVATDFAGAPVGADGMDFVWDVPELQNALTYHAEYRDFLETGCADCGPEIDGLVRTLALQAIDNAVITAQVPLRDTPKTLKFVAAQREAALAQRVDAIRPALDVMVELRGVYGRLRGEGGSDGQTVPHENFGNLAHRYVMSQLRELTRIAYDDSKLYQPTEHPDWSQAHAAAALFGLQDKASVEEYLTSQLNRVQFLANEYADPLLVYLGTGEATGEFTGGGDVTLWRETLVQLDKFQREDPTNTAALLAKLFTERLLAQGEEPCKVASAIPAPGKGVDVFSKAYAELWRRSSGHCRTGEEPPSEVEIELEEQTAYEELALAFNEKLAWHYPFVTSAKQTKREVDPADVVAFFKDHPIAGTDLIASVERSSASENKKKAVLRFLRGLADVEAMVTRTLLPPKGSPSGIVLDTEFRVNREHSKLDANIVHWRWKVGDTEVVYPRVGETASVRWEAGMPLSLTLQWATGADMRPIKAKRCKRTRSRVKDQNGTYSVGGQWALLRLMDCYRAERGDTEAALLGFHTRMAYTHAALEADARVFLRLRFMGVDPTTSEPVPVVIPERFPAFAPSL